MRSIAAANAAYEMFMACSSDLTDRGLERFACHQDRRIGTLAQSMLRARAADLARKFKAEEAAKARAAEEAERFDPIVAGMPPHQRPFFSHYSGFQGNQTRW